jgi:hypothetical protein
VGERGGEEREREREREEGREGDDVEEGSEGRTWKLVREGHARRK